MDVAIEREPLHNVFKNILDEARMILPGTQTLFGFQLVIVFTEYYQSVLTPLERYTHFIAILLTIIAFTIILSVTAYHRHTPIDLVSRKFVLLGSKLLKTGMFFLMSAISVDFFIVAYQTFRDTNTSILSSFVVLTLLFSFWYVLPSLNSKSLVSD